MDIDIIYALANGYNKKYPSGNDPFKICTRLLEECGELAKEVNHHEDTGVKVKKYGEPSRKNMAKELHDVVRTALSLAIYYNLETDLEESILSTFNRFKEDGYIE